ncbi:pyruvate, phosphate dikinase [uncultured Sneathiella sp.]|uniref:pyruvate, phosphate dikinase n=1 Tax=uncultured Sneathiella sp. TaxID=879315 RepID=UPI0030DD2544
MTKWVYSFGDGKADGTADMRNLLGGKGANLAEMSNLGLPVPSGFTITTEVCTAYLENDKVYPDTLATQVDAAIDAIEKSVGGGFGDAEQPLLVSVRSGARASMPGMMDTVLNLGLNDETVQGLEAQSGDKRFAYDSYRRFIQMYSDVVLGVEHYHFEELLEILKEENGYLLDTDLLADDWERLVGQYKAKVEEELGQPFPQSVQDQLWGAIGAVFSSWTNTRAITYRRLHDIPASWGTAVNVQAMVFGNMGNDSATGVAFTRDPSTGQKIFYGEFLVNAQGEDVVAGIRTPQNLTKQSRLDAGGELPSMEEVFPEVFAELVDVYKKLEAHYHDMQDIEFTVQQGKLWMLQTRSGKRTAKASLKIAIDMVNEGLIDKNEAIKRIDPASLDQLLHPTLDPNAERNVIARGLPASPGAASGQIVFNSDEAEKLAGEGTAVILVRVETSPEDIHGMHAAKGILTSRGGMTSHAAVVARGMGRACVSGAGSLNIDYKNETLSVLGETYKKGDIVTIDGGSGEVMLGAVDMIMPELSGEFGELMSWADEIRRMKVRANAETPLDAETARKFGAEGVGLCRTEHMFFDAERIVSVRQMILAETTEERREALAKLLPYQRGDFVDLFRIMAGLPVTIRLLDPPLHEFLPKSDEEIADLAKALGADAGNPMLGHRGCRLGISYPEIYEMQARAILEAAADVSKELGDTVIPEIMIPLVATGRELEILKGKIRAVADAIRDETGKDIEYLIGTMIELPRAALRAGDIARDAEFFSFGTNDLTQTTYGISRDDSGSFLEDYVSRAGIKLGICGEHGGDPASIDFCERVGLDYVSCSPYRVPIARLAAAQAALGLQRVSEA